VLVAVGAVVLVSASIASTSASAAGASSTVPAPPVVRTRTLVVSGSGPGYVDVRIPRRTVVHTSLLRYRGSSGPNRHVRISGDGPFTGVLIAPVKDQLGAGRDRFAVLGQFKGCSYGCADKRRTNFTAPLFTDRVVLRPNVYRVYFMAGESSPSRVAVTFLNGRKGKTFVTPSNAVALSTAVPDAAASSTPNVFSAGADYDVPEKGIRFSVMDLVMADRGSDGTYGTCIYKSQSDAPDGAKFLPGCPEGGPMGRRVTRVESVAEKFYVAEWEYMYEEGPWSFGMWHQSSIDILRVVHGTVFLGV
jgi:hypothetical protein